MARPKGTARAKKPISKQEYEKLIRAVENSYDMQETTKAKLYRAFTLLYLTGCRVSEITSLHVDDVEYMIENNEFSLTNNTKTDKPRLISFDSNRKQAELLKKILPQSRCYLFAKNNSDKPMTVSALKLMMNTFIHRTLGALYSTHSFRSGYITTAHQLGLSLEHIRQDIGHKDIATTARYATVTNEEISQGKNKRAW